MALASRKLLASARVQQSLIKHVKSVVYSRCQLQVHQHLHNHFWCNQYMGWRSFTHSSSLDAANRQYTDKHEWISVDNNVGTIGITNYAQEALGDVVYAQLPDEGSEFGQGDDCGALESVKAASELYCPVSGKVVAKNTAVEDKPGLINTSCYQDGWLIKLELSNSGQLGELMDEDGYNKFLQSQQDE